VTAVLRPFDLTHVQFVLLASAWWLNRSGEHPTQVALASFAGTDVKMTSQVLRSLERRGLIEREPHPADSRARTIAVTATGRRLAPRAIAVVERVDAEYFADVDVDAAVTLLGRLAAERAAPS